jgi:hypothetical protein
MPDMKHPAIEVDVIPAQTESLTLPQAHGYGNRVQGLQPMSFKSVQQLPYLIRREWLDLKWLGARWLHHGGNVPRHQTPSKRLVEGRAQDSVHAACVETP